MKGLLGAYESFDFLKASFKPQLTHEPDMGGKDRKACGHAAAFLDS